MRTFNQLSRSRKTSLSAGILYLITFVSIPTLALYLPIHKAGYITGTGPNTNIIIGCLLEIIVGLAGIGTAVALFPALKKQNEGMALGLVAVRTLEAATMFVGVAFLVTIVALRVEGARNESLVAGHVLVTMYDRMFLLGQSFLPAIDDFILGILLYRSRLVPRALSLIGIIGALPLIAGYLAVLFGLIEQRSALAGLSAAMVAVFEFSLGLYLVIKGFRSTDN